jgi:hypothetical protein
VITQKQVVVRCAILSAMKCRPCGSGFQPRSSRQDAAPTKNSQLHWIAMLDWEEGATKYAEGAKRQAMLLFKDESLTFAIFAHFVVE